MSGKNARGRTSWDKQGSVVAPPCPVASSSSSHQRAQPQPIYHGVAFVERARATPTNSSPHAPQAQLVDRLENFSSSARQGMWDANQLWVASEFAGDFTLVAAAAKEGHGRAQLALILSGQISADEKKKVIVNTLATLNRMAADRDFSDARGIFDVCLFTGLSYVHHFIVLRERVHKDNAITCLNIPAENGSATAQHVLGMFMYCFECESEAKADYLNAARWIRKAAMQGVMEAQYELGEMFRHGRFCKVHIRFTRNYIRRASRQGHVEAIARMKELRSCVCCGADDAQLACALCHQARYCNATCSEKHWCEGGGVGGGMSGGAGARHKDACPRMYVRRSNDAR